MKQDIVRIQNATDVARPTSIDNHFHTSIDSRLRTSIDNRIPASVDDNPPHPHSIKDYKVVNENTKACKSIPNNYEIVIVINTPTTMNNQFEALNAPKIDLPFFFLHSYELNTTSLSLSLHIQLKNPRF
ncbi:hypothetical protein YC2023_018178 [Brassica napus]